MPPKYAASTRSYVRERAKNLCEYCHTDERWQLVEFTIDHVIPVADGGTDDVENLALACFHCNRKKSSKQNALDSVTGEIIQLFNPRSMAWKDHFGWSDDSLRVVPKSACGKITVELLQLNRDRILQIRLDDRLVARHPPFDDRSH